MLLILYCPCCSQVDVIRRVVFCISGAARTCPAWKVQNSVLHVDWLWEPAQEISRVKPTQATCARCTYVVLLLSHHTVVMGGYLVYCVFVCTITDFSAVEKDTEILRACLTSIRMDLLSFWWTLARVESYPGWAIYKSQWGSRNWAPWVSGS